MSKRINVILPDKTVAVLDRVASRGTRSRFIDRAVRHYVETQGMASLREQLKAGYLANAERDLANMFFSGRRYDLGTEHVADSKGRPLARGG